MIRRPTNRQKINAARQRAANGREDSNHVPEDRQVFPEHSVWENLEIAERQGLGGSEWNRARAFELFPLLQPLRGRMAGRLSGGEQQMLTIARSLMGNPAVLLPDEPSEGLAPLIVQEIGALIRRRRELGTTIILAGRNSRFCLAVATLPRRPRGAGALPPGLTRAAST